LNDLTHQLSTSLKLARQFEEASMAELKRDPGDEIAPPQS
jgi:hypothetical protein